MFKNYLKITVRNLLRHKGYSFINITGLAVGMACCLLILFYIQDELSYDQYHEKADRIYRLVCDLKTPASEDAWALTAPAMAPVLRQDFPEVVRAIRIYPMSRLVQYRQKSFQEGKFYLADSSFFEVFSFELLRGDSQTALKEPYSVVLTEETAHKYFGDKDPIGEVLLVDHKSKFTVTGVMRNVPRNSHFTFDFLASFTTLESEEPSSKYSWGWMNFFTYVLLSEGLSPSILESKFPDFVERHYGITQRQSGISVILHLEPLERIYLHSKRLGQIGPTGDLANLYLFSIIALGILCIACFNFVNLATARYVNRMKEVGLRKTIGATRIQLISQFLGESILISFIASLLAICWVELFIPAFNTLAGKSVEIDFFDNAWFGVSLIIIALLVGIVAGSYPAFFLSAFKPTSVLKGNLQTGTTRAASIRKALVVFQFLLSISLMAGTGIIYRQLDYMRSRPLGFRKEYMLVINFGKEGNLSQNYEALKHEFEQHPGVVAVTASLTVPGSSGMPITRSKIEKGAGQEDFETDIKTLVTDFDFLKAYQIEIIAGRDFSKDRPNDGKEAFIINEAAVRNFGWTSPEEAIGKRVKQYTFNKPGTIIGVVKDFHFEGLQKRVEPLVIHIYPPWFQLLSVRVNTQTLPATLAFLENKWRNLVPGLPFKFVFLDELFDSQYGAEVRFQKIFTHFSGLAIFIACLGLFGLAGFMAEQRTKEIGIRKVLGATVLNLVTLLSKDFVKLVLLANLIAWPVAYYAMNYWLQDFAYRIEISWWVFTLAGGLALVIALATVSTQALKAALANPVESLRYE